MPIVVLSAVREEPARRRYEREITVKFAVDDYVEKPIAPDILLARVKRLIQKKQKA